MTVHPTPNRVLIKYDDPETRMGSILVSEWRKKLPNRGVVVSVGAIKDLEFPPVVGDHVELHPQYQGQKMEIDGKAHVIVHYENILGRYES